MQQRASQYATPTGLFVLSVGHDWDMPIMWTAFCWSG